MFDYDGVGSPVRGELRQVAALDPAWETRYDAGGRVVGRTWPDGTATGAGGDGWTYDAAGAATEESRGYIGDTDDPETGARSGSGAGIAAGADRLCYAASAIGRKRAVQGVLHKLG
jgi:hypothetical protein